MTKKTEVLQIRVTPEQKERYRQAAEQDGRSLTNWATKALDNELRIKPTTPRTP